MTTMRTCFRLSVLLVALAWGQVADATPIVLNIQRISSTQAIVTITGNLPASCGGCGTSHILSLVDPFGVDPAPSSNASVLGTTSLAVGASVIAFAHTAGSTYTGGLPDLYFGDYYFNGGFAGFSGFSGAMEALLPDSQWANVGATGDVYWGLEYGNQPGVLVGTWVMSDEATQVPEPASLLLLGTGLAIGASRMGKKRRTTV